jgi:hypothetical protein
MVVASHGLVASGESGSASSGFFTTEARNTTEVHGNSKDFVGVLFTTSFLRAPSVVFRASVVNRLSPRQSSYRNSLPHWQRTQARDGPFGPPLSLLAGHLLLRDHLAGEALTVDGQLIVVHA